VGPGEFVDQASEEGLLMEHLVPEFRGVGAVRLDPGLPERLPHQREEGVALLRGEVQGADDRMGSFG
jgi:hypothetical protein